MLKHPRDKLHTHVWEHDYKLLGDNINEMLNGK